LRAIPACWLRERTSPIKSTAFQSLTVMNKSEHVGVPLSLKKSRMRWAAKNSIALNFVGSNYRSLALVTNTQTRSAKGSSGVDHYYQDGLLENKEAMINEKVIKRILSLDQYTSHL